MKKICISVSDATLSDMEYISRISGASKSAIIRLAVAQLRAAYASPPGPAGGWGQSPQINGKQQSDT